MGGAERVLEQARRSFEQGDYRWVAEVVNHVVFADPDNAAARELQADALEQLGYGAENATWRNFYLAGAAELREGTGGTPTELRAADIVAQLSVEQILDGMKVRLDGPAAWGKRLEIGWQVSDPEEARLITVGNGVLHHRPLPPGAQPEATLVIERAALNEMLSGAAELADLAAAGRLRIEGDGMKLIELMGLLEEPDPSFPIVTPKRGARPPRHG
jgi:alkyl sulfatase BDS1-like metallo-beta-lactamase superfamily hydrolase